MSVRHLESVLWLEDVGECGWALKLSPTLLWVYPQSSLSLLMWAFCFSILYTTMKPYETVTKIYSSSFQWLTAAILFYFAEKSNEYKWFVLHLKVMT